MDYVLWEVSHANLIMLMETIPRVKKPGKEDKELDDVSSIENFLNS